MTDHRQEGNGRNAAATAPRKSDTPSFEVVSEAEKRALDLAESERQLRVEARSALADLRAELSATAAARDAEATRRAELERDVEVFAAAEREASNLVVQLRHEVEALRVEAAQRARELSVAKAVVDASAQLERELDASR